MNRPARDAQIDRAHRDKTGKILAQVLRFQNRIVTHYVPHDGIVRGFRSGVKGRRTQYFCGFLATGAGQKP
jgi:hypothetical protein